MASACRPEIDISMASTLTQVMHARSGGQYEIMGLMQVCRGCQARLRIAVLTSDRPFGYDLQGQLDGETFIVNDAFPLPIIGTETRVNAAEGANEFLIQYLEASPAVSWRLSRSVGACSAR